MLVLFAWQQAKTIAGQHGVPPTLLAGQLLYLAGDDAVIMELACPAAAGKL
jgi:hypothetical protein